MDLQSTTNVENDLNNRIIRDLQIIQAVLPSKPIRSELFSADIFEFLYTARIIDYTVINIIHPAFAKLSDYEDVEWEGSAFDEYDEENGYNDILVDVWEQAKNNIDNIINYSIKVLKSGYTDVMNTEILELIDHISYSINQNKGGE